MQTLKFQPLREKRQECHDIERYEFVPFNFEEVHKRVYSNVNLSIFVDDYCNADCKFCVAQLRFENRGQAYKKFKISNTQEYLDRLEYVLKYIKPLNPSISITGGEPTKSPRLIPILKLINECGYRKRTLTTNGSGLLDIIDGKTVLQYIAENKFQHLNISKAHFNENVNRDIMCYDNGYCSNEDISRIAIFSKANNLRPRMSCILLQEGIHDLEGIVQYLNFYQNLGVDNIIFRETMDFSETDMTNISKMQYLKNNKVHLNNIWNSIDSDSRFSPIRQLLGYYYYVEVYKYQNVDVVSESANLVKLYQQKQQHISEVFEMVFHPNGNLNGSWVDTEDILLKYK